MAVAALGYASIRADVELDGPEAQARRRELEGACRELDLKLVDVLRDQHVDARDGDPPPGLLRTLDRLDAGEASCLVVSGLADLGDGVRPLAAVLDRLDRNEARLVALDVGLDTATETGRLAVARRPATEPAPEEPAPADAARSEDTAPEAEVEVEVEPVAAAPVGTAPAPQAELATVALGYASVTADAEHGPQSLLAQGEAIRQRCRQLGIDLVDVVREREPRTGKALERTGLSDLVERLAAREAGCVVVTGLERLSRSVTELGALVQWLEENQVRLVAVDLDFDTAGPGGHTTARALASVAGWEHERISERTRKGLAAARAKRRTARGTTAVDFAAVRKRIATMRADGMTLQAIADVLNAEGVPTQRGGVQWRPSSVQSAAGYRRRTKSAADLPSVSPDRKST